MDRDSGRNSVTGPVLHGLDIQEIRGTLTGFKLINISDAGKLTDTTGLGYSGNLRNRNREWFGRKPA